MLDVKHESRDPTGRIPHQLVERGGDGALGAGPARNFGVGAVREHAHNAFVAQRCEPLQIDRRTDGRCVVDFEIPSVENFAERSFQNHGHRVREAMGDVHQLHAERPDREALSRCHLDELDVVQELVLVQPFPDHRDR